MRVLDNVIGGIVPGGIVLDLQTIRPAPEILIAGKVVGEVVSEVFFESADANNALLAARDDLVLEATDLHDVWIRADTGAELAEWHAKKATKPLPDVMDVLAASPDPCARRERCRTQRYRVL